MDPTKYFIGDNASVAFSRKYLDHEDLTASQVYADNTPYITLRAPGWYTKVTIVYAGDYINAKSIYLTDNEARSLRKALKTWDDGKKKKKKRKHKHKKG